MEILELRRKRSKILENMQAFLDSRSVMTAEDEAIFDKMEADVIAVDENIKRQEELDRQNGIPPLRSYPAIYPAMNADNITARRGVSDSGYRAEFVQAFRKGFYGVHDYLRESEEIRGGYLLPQELHSQIVAEMTAENALRQISQVITTGSQHRIPILASRPEATWTAEGQDIALSSPTFSEKVLDAYKMTVAISVSNELLSDSYFNIESFAAREFGRALGCCEEDAFLNGDGNGKPKGILPTLAESPSTTLQTAGASISADDVINLVHALKSPYRRNAVFLMSDNALAAIRKLKDSTQNYIYQKNLQAGEPERLLGYPVYTSEFMPAAASGNVCVLFGSFIDGFIIGDRGGIIIKPLYELHALQDRTTFLGISRVDGVVADIAAIKGLKLK